jgi:hypothetical protein
MKSAFQINDLVFWRQVSNFTGVISMMSVYGWLMSYLDKFACCYISIMFGIVHFYTMEIDYKYVLQVRPFAFLPFVLAIIAVLFTLYSQLI